jgi:hypothetical protein
MRFVLPVPIKAIFFTLECEHGGEANITEPIKEHFAMHQGVIYLLFLQGSRPKRNTENEIYKGPSVLSNIVHSALHIQTGDN